jgi:hypothetical protein
MYDFPEEIPGQMTPGQLTPELLQQYARAKLGIDITGGEAEKLAVILRAATQDAEGGGSIGDTDLTSSPIDGLIDVPTRGLPLEQIGASPNIPGATRGPSSGIGGIIPEDENRRRMRGVLSGQGLGY